MASLGTKTHLVLITDLYECGDAKSMPPRAAAIKQSGVTLIVLLAWPSSSVTHVARPAARIASPNIARAILGTAVYEPIRSQ